MAVMGEIIVEWFMEACDATKPASLWPIIQPAREITKCVKVPKFCHPKVAVNHSWEVLLDKNIPFLVFRGAHNWHKILYTPHWNFSSNLQKASLTAFTAADLGSSVPQQVGEELSFSSCTLHTTAMEPFDAPPSEIGLPPTVSIELLLWRCILCCAAWAALNTLLTFLLLFCWVLLSKGFLLLFLLHVHVQPFRANLHNNRVRLIYFVNFKASDCSRERMWMWK